MGIGKSAWPDGKGLSKKTVGDDMIPLVGVFDRNSYRSMCLMKDLKSRINKIHSYIVFDDSSGDWRIDETDWVESVDKSDLYSFISESYSLEKYVLADAVSTYKPLLKIFLALYVRRKMGHDYLLMVDNDVFLFRDIEEIAVCAEKKVPFLIKEEHESDTIPEITRYVGKILGLRINYEYPVNGKGYNVGFMGFDAQGLDSIDSVAKFRLLLDLMENLGEWHREQAFFVAINFASRKKNEIFDGGNYIFYSWNHNLLHYYMKSKIFHCIGTRNKEFVDALYAIRYGKNSMGRFSGIFLVLKRVFISVLVYFPVDFIRSISIYKSKKMLFSKDIVLNASRYKVLMEWISHNYCDAILEIGVWRGDTSEAMLKSSINKEVSYYGIDLFELSNEDIIANEASLKADAMDIVKDRLRKVSSNVHLFRGFSCDVHETIHEVGVKFDLVFIDGGHAYETVKQDFRDYSEMLSERGVIFLDDYTEEPSLPGVKKFVDKDLIRNRNFIVEICDRYVDQYRGYKYKIVKVFRN